MSKNNENLNGDDGDNKLEGGIGDEAIELGAEAI